MQGKQMAKGGGIEMEQAKSAGRRALKPGVVEYRVLQVPTGKQRVVHGEGQQIKTAAAAASVVQMEVRPGRRFFLIEAPEKEAAGFQRMIKRVVRVANVESPAAVERALDTATHAMPAAEPVVE